METSDDSNMPPRMAAMMEAMAPVAEAVGVDMETQAGSQDRPAAPVLNIAKGILEVCHEAAMLVRTKGLYIQGDRPVTVDEDGKVREMEPVRFISWLPRFCVIAKGTTDEGKPKRVDLAAKRAGEILASDTFKALIPQLTRVLPARLPVWNADRTGVRLLDVGYDPEHQVYVTRNAPEVEEMDVDDALAFFRSVLRSFPWGDEGRSMAAQMSAQVGMFVQMLFPQALAVPLFYWNANMEGSGKSILAEMVLAAVYGHCETGDFGQGDEFLKRLMSRALSYSSYFFMDDVAGMVRSQALNRWIVQPYWSDRKMHSHEELKVPKRCMTLITGNQATLSEDLIRRGVIIDLFSEKSASERLAERGCEHEVTSEWLSKPETRSKMLSSMWAMVQFWASEGCPNGSRPIPSFVTWSEIVGGIVETCGFGDPFAPAGLQDGGDKWHTEWMQLFSAIVRRFDPTNIGVEIPLPEWCAVAREHGLYLEKLGDVEVTRMYLEDHPRLWKVPNDSPFGETEKREQALRYMDPQKQASPFAKILRKREGRNFVVDGKTYKFSDRNAKTSVFTVRLKS